MSSSVDPSPDTPQAPPSQVDTVTSTQAAAAAEQQTQIRSLATALTTSDPTTYAQVMKGKLMGFTTTGYPPLCSIQLGGDTSATIDAVRYIDSYSPVVGDTVLVVKQGSELFVLGQMTENLTSSQSGWQTPTLTTTWNANLTPTELTPARYRKVFDNGSYKIQLMGRVWRNGTGTLTTLWTMPSGFIPGTVRSMVTTRENLNGGSNAIQLQANTDGTIVISGQQLDTSAAQHGNLTTSYYNTDHVHTFWDDGQTADNTTDANNDSTSASKYTFGGGVFNDGVIGGAAGDGGNSPNHRHTTASATHVHSMSFPGWVSLDGIEYFL